MAYGQPRAAPAAPAVHHKLAARGFQVLAFPCNQFGNQEPARASPPAPFARPRRRGRGGLPPLRHRPRPASFEQDTRSTSLLSER